MNYFEIIRRRRESVCNNKCEPIELMHDYVSSVLESHDLQMCQTVYLSLVNHDYQKGHIYEDEVRRLANQTDEMKKASHEPCKVVNIYQKGSCNFGPGSTQNGNVLLNQ